MQVVIFKDNFRTSSIVCLDSFHFCDVACVLGFTREGGVGNTGHWSDETKTDTVIGNWMANQPDDKSGMCVKVSNDTNKLYPWTMHWCGAKLPFVCQIHACLEGRWFYVVALLFIPEVWDEAGSDTSH